MWCIHGEADQYDRGYVNVRIANRRGRMRVGLAPELDSQMIVGWDWSPLYEVLEEVHRDELRWKGWPRLEGWVAKEEASSSGEQGLVNLGAGAMGPQFRMAQEADEEFLRIREEEVAHIKDEVTRPDLDVSDPHFEMHNGLLYWVRKCPVWGNWTRQLMVPHPFHRRVWGLTDTTPMRGHFGRDKTLQDQAMVDSGIPCLCFI